MVLWTLPSSVLTSTGWSMIKIRYEVPDGCKACMRKAGGEGDPPKTSTKGPSVISRGQRSEKAESWKLILLKWCMLSVPLGKCLESPRDTCTPVERPLIVRIKWDNAHDSLLCAIKSVTSDINNLFPVAWFVIPKLWLQPTKKKSAKHFMF